VTVAGLLVGGAGTAMHVATPTSPGHTAGKPADTDGMTSADRAVTTDRVSRSDSRQTPAAAADGSRVIDMGTCDASYYDHPQPTADGEMFDPTALTAAHETLPFNTRVRVTNVANAESVVVRINDRGPFIDGRCLDLSKAAFASIANPNTGVIDVRYEVLVQDAT
jgi:rare lipoprotein A